MWVVREGYEGLVRGNADAVQDPILLESRNAGTVSNQIAQLPFVKSLRFGDGELFKQGEGDAEDRPDKKTLKGRYIVKVGWDDVRGWMGEVGDSWFKYVFVDDCAGRNFDRYCPLCRVPYG